MGPFLHPEDETIPRKELEKLQLRRLKAQVKRCYEHSEFYRERLKEARVHPNDITSLGDLHKIPFVTKQELREEQAEHPPFGRYAIAPPSSWRELHPSTGTTGNPVNTIWSEQDVLNITEVTARTMRSFGVRRGHVIQNAFSYGLWIAGVAVHYAARRLSCFIIPTGAAATDRQIDYLRSVQPNVLLSTPSFALYIAEKLREKDISPETLSLELGCFGGEPGTEVPSTRRRIEEGLGINAYDYYGLAEIGPTMASECMEKVGIHWSEDHHIVEVVNPKTKESCGPGEEGVLVITHLTREATPMLRYWTNDLAKLELDRCGCGRTHARSPGGILGRTDDMMVYRGAKFYPLQVEKVVRSFGELGQEFRIILERDEKTRIERYRIVAEYRRGAETPDLEGRLKKALKEELSVTPEVELVPEYSLERTTFKAQRIVDKRTRH